MTHHDTDGDQRAITFANERVGNWGGDQTLNYTGLTFFGVGLVVIVFGGLAGMNIQDDHTPAMFWTSTTVTAVVWLFCRSQTKRWWEVYECVASERVVVGATEQGPNA